MLITSPFISYDSLAHLGESILGGVFSGGVIAWFLNYFTKQRMLTAEENIKHKIEEQYSQSMAVFQSTSAWKERAVAELLGPMYMNFDRSKRAFDVWTEQNLYLEANVIREANMVIRDLLLTKAELIPQALRGDAGKLIHHYDRWLEEYDRVRGSTSPDLSTKFVFVGPKRSPFPKDSERAFKNEFEKLWRELYLNAAL